MSGAKLVSRGILIVASFCAGVFFVATCTSNGKTGSLDRGLFDGLLGDGSTTRIEAGREARADSTTACKKWEVTKFMAPSAAMDSSDGVTWKKSSYPLDRWTLSEGWEPFASEAASTGVWARRCVSW